jgi:ActR/RegA family two-component response regulator
MSDKSVNEEKLRVLVLEDDHLLLRTLEKSLSHRYSVVATPSLRVAISMLEGQGAAQSRFDAFICDFHLADGHGTVLLEKAQSLMPLARRILLTVAVPNLTTKEIETGLVQKILTKPCGFEDIRRAIEGVPA